MDRRSASHAFFSVFRSWSILCRPRLLHTTSSWRRSKRDDLDRPVRFIGRRNRFLLQSRIISTQQHGQPPSSEADSAESNVNIRKEYYGRPGRSNPASRYIRFDPAIIDKYPELEITGFLGTLRSHIEQISQGSPKRELGGAGALKALMRSMPHPTVLVTTLADEPVQADKSLKKSTNLSPYYRHFRGAIVSSMTSVTLGPPAIISFNFKEPSATLAGIRANRFFTIHFLRAGPAGAHLAMQFLSHPGDHHAAWQGASTHHETTVTKQLDFRASAFYAPQIPATPVIDGPGVASHIICEILPEKCVSNVGDHSIIVAKVVSGPLHAQKDPARDVMFREGFPPLLLYSQGQFKEHGSAVEIPDALAIGTETVQERGERENSHPDFSLRRILVNAGEPMLYRAATSYMDSVLYEHSNTEHYKHLRAFYAAVDAGVDRRAKFVGALRMWQFQRRLRRNENIADLRIREAAYNPEGINGTMNKDPKVREVAEELLKLAIEREDDGAELGWLHQAYKDSAGLADRTKRGGKISQRMRSLNLKPLVSGNSPMHVEGTENVGSDMPFGDVLQKMTLKRKYEATQPSGDAEQERQADEQRPSY